MPEFNIDFPAVGTSMDTTQPPAFVGQGGVPLLAGIDPSFEGVWRRLPGMHRVSQTMLSSRVDGTQAGLAIDDPVGIDFFKPVVVKYGSQPYEKRGFVLSVNNVLLFKYYDTKAAAWAYRVLVTDLDAQFGTRTEFDVTVNGRYLYVSRSGLSVTNFDPTKTPLVLWWEPEGWRHFGGGAADLIPEDFTILTACYFQGELYIGGSFTEIAGRTCRHIAKFNGQYFEEVAGGLDDVVRALYTPDNETLYIGGDFIDADEDGLFGGPVTLTRVAIFNGRDYHALGAGANGSVYAFAHCTVASALTMVIGGDFTSLGGTASNRIILQTISSGAFTAVTTGCNGVVRSIYPLSVTGDEVWVGGAFSSAGGVANTPMIAKLDCGAGTFTAVGRGVTAGTGVFAVYYLGTDLYIGGTFTQVTNGAGANTAVNNIARWNGSAWSSMNSGITIASGTPTVRAISSQLQFDGSEYIVAGGSFDRVNGSSTTGVGALAVYNGTVWAELGGGVNPRPTVTAGRVDHIERRDELGQIGTIIVAGQFKTVDSGDDEMTAWNIATYVAESEVEAAVGARHWKEWEGIFLNPLTAITPGASAPAAFKQNSDYAVMLTLADPPRGFQTPPSNPVAFHVSTDNDNIRRITFTVPEGLRLTSLPTKLRVWRSIGIETDTALPVGDPLNGPFYLEAEVDYEPSTGLPGIVECGLLSDAALVAQTPYNPLSQFPGAHGDSPAIGVSKGVLFSLSSSFNPNSEGQGIETYWDIRWSPPYQNTPEYTTANGFFRTRAGDNDLPRFIEVGDFLLFCTPRRIVRLHVQSDFVVPIEGQTGIGVVNREAMAAVGNELWFVSSGGEFLKMNAGTMTIEPLFEITRLLQTRWKYALRDSRMLVAYDAASKILVVGPRQDSSDKNIPTEFLAIHVPSRRPVWVGDVYHKWMISGVDPETGEDTLFFVSHTGVFTSPDWKMKGPWVGHGTWGDNHFYTTGGITGTSVAAHAGAFTSLGGGNYQLDAPATVNLDRTDHSPAGIFSMCVPCRVYLSRQSPRDSTKREIFAVGTVYAQTDQYLMDIAFTGGYNRILYGVDITDATEMTDLRIHFAPVTVMVVLPVPRDPNAPSLIDSVVVDSLGLQFGDFGFGSVTTPVALEDFLQYGTYVLDDAGWWFDKTADAYQGLPFPAQFVSTADSTDENVRQLRGDSIIPAHNPDNCWMANGGAKGHNVFPMFLSVSTNFGFELLAASFGVIIDKATYGISSPS